MSSPSQIALLYGNVVLYINFYVFFCFQPNPFGATGGFGQTGIAGGFGAQLAATGGLGAFGAKPTTGFGATSTAPTGGKMFDIYHYLRGLCYGFDLSRLLFDI